MDGNREDSLISVQFLKAVKERTGSIKPRWFMSDDAAQFFNAWTADFGDHGIKRLLCAWHIDKSWRCALREHVKN